MLTRYQSAQQAELREWNKGRKELLNEAIVDEFRLLGVDVLGILSRVLDIGGAYGKYVSMFSNASERIVIDPLYGKFGIALKGVTGISACGEELPFESGSVNFIILRNVIDHMLEPARLLSESRRVLAPVGSLYFMVNTFISVTRPLFPILARYDKPHPLHFTVNNVRKLIVSSGFRIKKERLSSSGAFEWRIKRLIGRLIKREYYALLVPV